MIARFLDFYIYDSRPFEIAIAVSAKLSSDLIIVI
jgi:hypothetical protein